jgi:nitrite reductase/ring-hydroxylating ferredoxin subunit
VPDSSPWQVVCRHADLGDPDAREFTLGEGSSAVDGFVVQLDGRVMAYVNVCPHKQHPLNLADGHFLVPGQRLLRCASHQALFDPESGLCLAGPCSGRRLTPLHCELRQGDVRVSLPARVASQS